MTHLDNTNKRLMEGLVILLRENVDGFPLVSGDGYTDVPNVWTEDAPVQEDGERTFPYGAVDIITANDFEMSVEMDVRLREAFVRVVVFGESSATVEDLIDDCEREIGNRWDEVANDPVADWSEDTYTGDWSYRQMEGMTELTENSGTEGKLRYNRSIEVVFECVRTND